MKTLLRSIVWLALVIWLGGLFFFPITAAAAFGTLTDTHLAGTIVRTCLLALHHEGLFCGGLIVILLALGRLLRVYQGSAIAGIVVTLIMLGLTAFSQFWIIPRMETYRIAAGGVIEAVPPTNPNRVAFDHLHRVSVDVEEGVMLGGVILVFLLAHASSEPRDRYA
ncbi:MAG TPA: DUF4149 domain-containing protein [Acidobacteriaceae bacterium]|nr:DUF4149 domain-containing protein [Acidobacteriaceae bacterium]